MAIRRSCAAGISTLILFLINFLSSSYADEANNNNNGAFYGTLQQSACFNVKIQEDDDGEGNSYFYNGAYRSLFERYISFRACSQAADEDGGASSDCSLYVTELEAFLEPAVNYLQNYCNSCGQKCRRNLRFLEEEDQGGENYAVSVDCSTCSDTCSYEYNDAANEANTLQCQQQQYNGGNNNRMRRLDEEIEYYTGPGCYNGQVIIGKFYDDECSIKASYILEQEYPLFDSLSSLQLDCSGNSEVCQELMQDAVSCAYPEDDDTARLCNTAAKAGRTRSFARKRAWYQRPGSLVFLAVVVGIITTVLGFLAHTYFVRHKSTRKAPLASLDQEPKPEMEGPTVTAATPNSTSSPPWAQVN